MRKRGLVHLALTGVASTLPVVSWAQEPSPDAQPAMEVHHTAAGTDDGTGWFAAVSTHGGFKVALPAKFNDYTIRTDDPNMGEVITDVLGAERTDGLRVQISETHGTPKSAAADLDSLLAGLKANAPEGQSIVASDKGTVGALSALSVTAEGAGGLAYIRYLTDGKDLYFISVECLSSMKTECEAVRDKVYATFVRN